MDLDHAADGVVGLAQVQQVVIGQIPLSVRRAVEDGNASIGQSRQHATLDVAGGKKYSNVFCISSSIKDVLVKLTQC